MTGKTRFKKIILASASPRRHYLMEQTGLKFTVLKGEADEDYPDGMNPEEIPIFLSEKKAAHFSYALKDDSTVLITADTMVWLDEEVLGKPVDHEDAVRMLKAISGRMHVVYTGVTLSSRNKKHSFLARTDVYFRVLTDEEIHEYLLKFKPYDKAGAYGIQEWIGYIGVERIEGSYFNVMGLPVQMLYHELLNF